MDGVEDKVSPKETGLSKAHDSTRTLLLWGAMGAGLLGIALALRVLSFRFEYGLSNLARPIVTLVVLYCAMGIIYLVAVRAAFIGAGGTRLLFLVGVVGLLLRLAMVGSGPILEDDFYRYLFDGAMTANGHNPYVHAPRTILQGTNDDVSDEVRTLGARSGAVGLRVNHPRLRTVYPPVAQGAFAAAYLAGPWSLHAWRLVLLVFDIATLGLLLLLLRFLGKPMLYSMVYWWNPIVVKEIFNSGHMDVIIMPFVLGGLLLTLQRRHVWASGCLALAVGVKLWPIILLPLLWRSLLRRPGRLAVSLLVFGGITLVLLLPILVAGGGSDSGFLQYGKSWEMNDSLFMLLLWGAQGLYSLAGWASDGAMLAARGGTALLLCLWIFTLVRRESLDGEDLLRKALLICAALFLLSPTQFPWYYVWIVPLLAVRPAWSLLVLTALLPLYYLRFRLKALNRVDLFDYGVVWVEFLPVWILLTVEWVRGRWTQPVLVGSAA